jgi:hypothetical protein
MELSLHGAADPGPADVWTDISPGLHFGQQATILGVLHRRVVVARCLKCVSHRVQWRL